MRTYAARKSGLLVSCSVVLLAAGCELITEGRSNGRPEEGDGSITFPSQACDLACAQGSHCELDAQTASCVKDRPLGLDAAVHTDAAAVAGDGASHADAAPLDAATPPPPVGCTPACVHGSHCVTRSTGASCEPDAVPDASTPPRVCNLDCILGSHCEVSAQGPHCVADPVVDAGGPTPCGTATCAAGQQCCSPSCGICTASGSACPAIACLVDAGLPPAPCASTSCPVGTICDDSSGVAQCLAAPSCDGVVCDPGSTCELVQVQCVRAPCPPIPECVVTPPDCVPACKAGTHCATSTSGSKCVADSNGPVCGSTVCAASQICCSASCGICGPKNGVCPAIACAAGTTP